MHDEIESHIAGLSETLHRMPIAAVQEVAELMLSCHRRGGTVFLAGNGGSAATASHFACDLAKGTRCEGAKPFRVVALTDNVPVLTAWANDANYECIFAEQLAALAGPEDLLLVISASGNSPNIVAAAGAAKDAGMRTIALSGSSGGAVGAIADITVRVEAETIEQVEDGHSVITHGLTVALRSALRRERRQSEGSTDRA